MDDENIDVSIIIPIHNGGKWIDKCFQSIITQQTNNLKLELSICNDSSTDNTLDLINKWNAKFTSADIKYTITMNITSSPLGVGYAKNVAIQVSSGKFLCFQDIDDQMLPNRIQEQYNAARLRANAIIGCQFERQPPNSTHRYTKWANSLNQNQLNVQIYTSHGPTVIMPTWFFHRSVFDRVGAFSEKGKGTPEDLIFFYKHLDLGGDVYRVDKCLLTYTYHTEATTFSISSDSIWDIRLERLQKHFLSKHDGFTIWNAGKQGRKLLKCLNEVQRAKVKALCDVDVNKIGKTYEMFCPIQRKVICTVPIVHFSEASPPFVICIKLDLTDGAFEENLSSLNLREGEDYVLFS